MFPHALEFLVITLIASLTGTFGNPCGDTYDTEEGEIVSPEYPNEYPWKTDCKWQVNAPEGQHVSFQVYDFDLQSDCNSNAYVSVSNLQDPTDSSKKFCGKAMANLRLNTLGTTQVSFWVRDPGWWEEIWGTSTGHTGFRIKFLVKGCKKAELPQKPEYGIQANPKSLYSETDVAKFTCKDGFRYSDGEKDLTFTCSSDNKWHRMATSVWPTCLEIKCSQPDGPMYGDVDVQSTKVGGQANYSCKANYVLEGVSIRVCQKDGTWSDKTPVCKAPGVKACRAIGDPQHGRVEGNGTSVNSVLEFNCHVGYTLNGHQNITCQADGMWSGEKPACDIVRCPELSAPVNGSITDVDPLYNSVVTYTCDYGFKLTNTYNGERQCLASGEWSGKEPQCIGIQCPPPNLPHGWVDYDYLEVGGRVNYTCMQGYELVGKATAVCLETGKWSQDFPPRCRSIRCPPLVNLTHAYTDTTANRYGDQVTVICSPGFFFDKNMTINRQRTQCLETKEWKGDATAGCPYTIGGPTGCPPVEDLDFGHLIGNDTSVNASISFECVKGYALNGPNNITCHVDGSWSGRKPTCDVVKCPRLVEPENGHITLDPLVSVYQSIATYYCDEGYRLSYEESNGTRKCLWTGRWSGPELLCEGHSTPNVTGKSTTHTITGTTTVTGNTTLSPELSSPSTPVTGDNVTSTVEETTTKNVNVTHSPGVTSPSTPPVTGEATNITGNATLSPGGNGTFAEHKGTDKSGMYIGIGIGSALLLIVLVMLALWYFRMSNSGSGESSVAMSKLYDEQEDVGGNAYENPMRNIEDEEVGRFGSVQDADT